MEIIIVIKKLMYENKKLLAYGDMLASPSLLGDWNSRLPCLLALFVASMVMGVFTLLSLILLGLSW